jgi:hypothetical protein
MRVWLAVGVLVVAGISSEPSLSASDPDAAALARYPASARFAGHVRTPQFAGRDRKFATFRTRIREGIKAGPNFAGHFVLVGWGCGTDCVDYVVADVATGKVFHAPLSGEEEADLRYDVRINSRLMIARWVTYMGERAPGGARMEQCLKQSFVWRGEVAVPLAKPAIAATVEPRHQDSCDSK